MTPEIAQSIVKAVNERYGLKLIFNTFVDNRDAIHVFNARKRKGTFIARGVIIVREIDMFHGYMIRGAVAAKTSRSTACWFGNGQAASNGAKQLFHEAEGDFTYQPTPDEMCGLLQKRYGTHWLSLLQYNINGDKIKKYLNL